MVRWKVMTKLAASSKLMPDGIGSKAFSGARTDLANEPVLL
jgi:hypothetical protein